MVILWKLKWDIFVDCIFMIISQEKSYGDFINITSRGGLGDNVDYTIPVDHEKIKSELIKILGRYQCLVVADDKFNPYGSAFECFQSHFHFLRTITQSKFLFIFGSHLNPPRPHICLGQGGFSRKETWQQLQTIIGFVKDCSEYKQLETLGWKIAEGLKGWEWAIMITGGVLAAKKCPTKWQKRFDYIVFYMIKFNDPLKGIFMLSYIDLMTELKSCLLYLRQFPAGYEINVSRLVRIWIAEGFVSSRKPQTAEEGETLEDLAESNLIKLISRCLVLVGDRDANLRVKTCYLDETMRSLCLLDANLSSPNFKIGSTESDFAIHNHIHSYRFSTSVEAELMSLLFFRGDFGRNAVCYPDLNKHRLLRVLDLEGADFGEENLPKGIGDLIYLRYLSLRNARLSKIPSTLGNLRFLQTLDLLVEGIFLYIPNVIWKLNRLRHLFFPEVCHTKAKLRLDTLTNLRTLLNFPARNCNPKDIFIMTKLRELTIRDAMSIRNCARFSKLVGMRLKHLQSFSLHDSSREGDKGAEEHEDIISASFGDTVVPRT